MKIIGAYGSSLFLSFDFFNLSFLVQLYILLQYYSLSQSQYENPALIPFDFTFVEWLENYKQKNIMLVFHEHFDNSHLALKCIICSLLFDLS